MYKGNYIAKNLLPGPQAYKLLQLKLKFALDDTMNGSSQYFGGLLKCEGGQDKVDATYSRLDRSEDLLLLFRLFRCTFMTL